MALPVAYLQTAPFPTIGDGLSGIHRQVLLAMMDMVCARDQQRRLPAHNLLHWVDLVMQFEQRSVVCDVYGYLQNIAITYSFSSSTKYTELEDEQQTVALLDGKESALMPKISMNRKHLPDRCFHYAAQHSSSVHALLRPQHFPAKCQLL